MAEAALTEPVFTGYPDIEPAVTDYFADVDRAKYLDEREKLRYAEQMFSDADKVRQLRTQAQRDRYTLRDMALKRDELVIRAQENARLMQRQAEARAQTPAMMDEVAALMNTPGITKDRRAMLEGVNAIGMKYSAITPFDPAAQSVINEARKFAIGSVEMTGTEMQEARADASLEQRQRQADAYLGQQAYSQQRQAFKDQQDLEFKLSENVDDKAARIFDNATDALSGLVAPDDPSRPGRRAAALGKATLVLRDAGAPADVVKRFESALQQAATDELAVDYGSLVGLFTSTLFRPSGGQASAPSPRSLFD